MAEQNSKSFWRGRIIRYAPLLLLTTFILVSSRYATMSETSHFMRPLLEFLFPSASPEFITTLHGFFRKLAHPCVYGILAFLGSRAFFYSSQEPLKKYWHLTALSFVLAVAIIDEIQQSFVPGRSGIAGDVVLDMAGAAVAVLIFHLFHRNRTKAA